MSVDEGLLVVIDCAGYDLFSPTRQTVVAIVELIALSSTAVRTGRYVARS